MESDPIGLAGGISTYGYVFENPLQNVDPLGLDGGGIYTNPDTRMATPGGAITAADVAAARTALGIMGPLSTEMKKKYIPYVDQFYHCLAACRATKATGNKAVVIELMNTKEATDWWRWLLGSYAKHFDTSAEMQADNAEDKAVNLYGASCPSGVNCIKRCRNYLNLIPVNRRAEMSEYVPEWAPKGK